MLFTYLVLMIFGSTFVSCTINHKEVPGQDEKEKHEFRSKALTSSHVCNVTIIGGLIGKSWSVCIDIPDKYQRLEISYGKTEENVMKCSKLGPNWIPYPEEIVRKEGQIEVKCPDENNLTMCLLNFNGSKADGGYLHFSVNENENGEWRELCSRYLVLKYMEYPMIITRYIDYMNRELLLMSDVVQTAEINASAFFENMFLCPLHWKEESEIRGKMCQKGCLGCNVSDEAINTISEMYGWNIQYPVTLVYTFPYGKRSTKTQEKLEIRRNTSTGTKDNNVLGTGEIVVICFAILFLILRIILGFLHVQDKQMLGIKKIRSHNSNTAVKYNECSKEEEVKVV